MDNNVVLEEQNNVIAENFAPHKFTITSNCIYALAACYCVTVIANAISGQRTKLSYKGFTLDIGRQPYQLHVE